MKRVRVRFAPSPTGKLHIGGVRTALYNYLFAKKHGGDFILRIEDTDEARFDPDAEAYILDALKWLGIMPTEGVGDPNYKQSVRNKTGIIYETYVNKLLEEGNAYIAFDTAESLDEMRKKYDAMKKTFSYNAYTRTGLNNSLTLPADKVKELMGAGTPYVVRLKVPKGESITFTDEVRGSITVKTDTIDDKVLWKSTKMPTYHLANVVDDHLMEITHVIRGEEWLPSAPFHVLLYKMLGWDSPAFAHLPLILAPSGKGKLSKRDGDAYGFPVFPLEWKNPENGEVCMGYREKGFLPGAVLNILALLGWNPGNDIEVMSLDEMTTLFSLDKVNKAGARFDLKKALWFQKEYVTRADNYDLAEMWLMNTDFDPWAYNKTGTKEEMFEYCAKVCGALKEKYYYVSQFGDAGIYFFKTPAPMETPDGMKGFHDDFVDWMVDVHNWAGPVDHDKAKAAFDASVSKSGVDAREAGKYLRAALTGATVGPPIFDVIAILGIDECLKRMYKKTDFAERFGHLKLRK